MATVQETARAAGVSASVVSRILNGDTSLRVSAETRSRVLEAIERLDCSPNFAARALRSAKSGLLALVVYDFGNPVYPEIIAGAQQEAASFGKSVLLGEGDETAGKSGSIRDLVGGGGADGLILQGVGGSRDRDLVGSARRWMPTVLLQSGDAEGSTLVRLDDAEAGRIAAERLLDLGHTRIGCLGTRGGLRITSERKKGWVSALRSRGHRPQEEWFVPAGSTYLDGARAAADLLRATPGLTALVCCNVIAAVGALSAMTDLGRTVPDDLSLVAIHDAEIAEFVRPALTVVKTPLRQLGAAAARECCAKRSVRPAEVVVRSPEPKLVKRGSDASPSK